MSPAASLDDIELHIRTYRSLLKGSGEIRIEKLIDSHNRMRSILHEKGEEKLIDIAAFIYSLLRLPASMSNVKTVILGQSFSVFKHNGFDAISQWREVNAAGRRRKMYYDGRGQLAMYIASVSDVDDIVTILTAFQVEWNKFHTHLVRASDVEAQAAKLLPEEDIGKIKNIWGEGYRKFLTAIKHKTMDITVQLLSGSYVEYAKATASWWDHIVRQTEHLAIEKRPIYFISSNTHSVINVLTRFAASREEDLIEYLTRTKNTDLLQLWTDLLAGKSPIHRENFLYYIAKKYAKSHPEFIRSKRLAEQRLGIHTIPASHFLDIDAQVIEVRKLASISIDSRLDVNTRRLADSDAMIINIDYPLGWAGYQVLSQIGQNTDTVKGVYIMGKAATLNGQIGDILLPNTVFDQHTKNTYVINNAFTKKDFTAIFSAGTVLDNQKTCTVKGTFLQSRTLIEQWYRDGFTDIEMEAGTYLNAAYEFVYYNRYEENQFVNLVSTPFELGVAHYASDTPYSKAKNLGVRNLSYEGIEPTYAISLAIVKKIIERETG